MFVFANLLAAIAKILNSVLNIYMWIIIIRALISFVNPDPYNPIVIFLKKITNPILRPISRVIPPIGMVDLSPLIAILLIQFIQFFLVNTLFDFALNLK